MAGGNLSKEIYETLTERINQWIYPPGHRLTEEELCAEFEVSRSPVREALNRLTQSNLIEKKERKGYTVRHITMKEINDLYDTRVVLEVAVIERICKKGLDTDVLKDLEKRWKRIEETLPDMADEAAVEDEYFHEKLAEAAENQVVARLLKDIDCRIHFVRISDITSPERMQKTCHDHLELLEALTMRDCKRAQNLVRQNIEWGREKVATAMKEALARAHRVF